MRIFRYPANVLWAAVLLIIIGSCSLVGHLEHKTQQTVQLLEHQLRDPAYRDQFEKDYKPAFDLLHRDSDPDMERESELKDLLKQRFPEMSRFTFIRRDTGYLAKLYFGRACMAYISADPQYHPDFIPGHETIATSYPRFLVLWYPGD